MFDLKPYFDAAQEADAEVQRVMNEMNAAFGEGTENGKQTALEMRPALDAARTRAKDANDLYVSMRDAASSSDVARKFVPANSAAVSPRPIAGGSMKRDDFLALDAAARMAHIKAGGEVIDG